MTKYNKIVVGLVIELPDDMKHNGVILDTTRLNKDWYKVTILCDDGDILICKLKLRGYGDYLDHKDCVRYDAMSLLTGLRK